MTDAHTCGTLALMDVARAAMAALEQAVENLSDDPKRAVKAVSDHATLLSKCVDSLAKKIDDLPPEHRAVETRRQADVIDFAAVPELTRLMHLARLERVCLNCGGLTE